MPHIAEIEALFAAIGPIPTPAQQRTLRDRVCAWVDAARAEGMRAEEVLVTMRDALRRAGNHVSVSMAEEIVQWCLERYFETQPSAHKEARPAASQNEATA